MIIRQEQKSDFSEIYQLIKTAFLHAEHRDGNEQDLVAALRKSSSFIPALSLVAEKEKKIVGYILFTEATIDNQTVLVLAPLAVLPKYQKQGIGSALIQEGHKIAKALGYSYSIVLGSETYYPRFGYLPAQNFGIEIPDGIPSPNFMAIPLQKNVVKLHGSVQYPKEFNM